jgi:hypothetical protein
VLEHRGESGAAKQNLFVELSLSGLTKPKAEDVIRQISFQRRRKRNANLKQESSDANDL